MPGLPKSQEVRRSARELYLRGLSAESIGSKLNVSTSTVVKWAASEGWAEIRSASQICRPELRNKLLRIIDQEVTRYEKGKQDEAMGDKLVKLTAAVKNLDVGLSLVDIIEVLTQFTKWLENTAALDPRLTVDFRKQVNIYLDAFVRYKTTE